MENRPVEPNARPEPTQDNSWSLNNNQHPVWPIILLLSVLITFILGYALGCYVPHQGKAALENRYDDGYKDGWAIGFDQGFQKAGQAQGFLEYSVSPGLFLSRMGGEHPVKNIDSIYVRNDSAFGHWFTLRAVSAQSPVTYQGITYYPMLDPRVIHIAEWPLTTKKIYIPPFQTGEFEFYTNSLEFSHGNWCVNLNISSPDSCGEGIDIDYEVKFLVSRY